MVLTWALSPQAPPSMLPQALMRPELYPSSQPDGGLPAGYAPPPYVPHTAPHNRQAETRHTRAVRVGSSFITAPRSCSRSWAPLCSPMAPTSPLRYARALRVSFFVRWVCARIISRATQSAGRNQGQATYTYAPYPPLMSNQLAPPSPYDVRIDTHARTHARARARAQHSAQQTQHLNKNNA